MVMSVSIQNQNSRTSSLWYSPTLNILIRASKSFANIQYHSLLLLPSWCPLSSPHPATDGANKETSTIPPPLPYPFVSLFLLHHLSYSPASSLSSSAYSICSFACFSISYIYLFFLFLFYSLFYSPLPISSYSLHTYPSFLSSFFFPAIVIFLLSFLLQFSRPYSHLETFSKGTFG